MEKQLSKKSKRKKLIIAITMIVILLLSAINFTMLIEKNRILPKKANELEQTNESLLPYTEATYTVNEINEDNMNVTIIIKNDLGIHKIVEPNGNELAVNNKNTVAIDYNVVSGQNYVFKIQAQNETEEKEYTLSADINAKPIIQQGAAYAYPILYDTGFKVERTVSIDYGEATEKFYSIDGGNTWIEYTGDIKIHNECNLIAKTKNAKNEIAKIDNKKITLGLANDAIGPLAYDGNESTSERCFWGCKFYVDSSAWGKTLNVKFNANISDRYNYLYLYLYKYDSTVTNFFLRECDMGTEPSNPTTQTKTITIPQDTYYVKTSDVRDYYGQHRSCIFEMWITD